MKWLVVSWQMVRTTVLSKVSLFAIETVTVFEESNHLHPGMSVIFLRTVASLLGAFSLFIITDLLLTKKKKEEERS